jgi:hypothetical protein
LLTKITNSIVIFALNAYSNNLNQTEFDWSSAEYSEVTDPVSKQPKITLKIYDKKNKLNVTIIDDKNAKTLSQLFQELDDPKNLVNGMHQLTSESIETLIIENDKGKVIAHSSKQKSDNATLANRLIDTFGSALYSTYRVAYRGANRNN